MSKKLLVIPAEPVSGWISKGEVIDRYFNPGDLFDEVHLLLLTDESPDQRELQRLVGRAKVSVHHMRTGKGLFARSLAWRPTLLRPWADEAIQMAAAINPLLVRCYGAHLNGIAALAIKRKLDIPYVVSLHINPDEDLRGRTGNAKQKIAARAQRAVEAEVLRNADLVLPVYKPIIPYLRRLGVKRFEVAYNMINPSHLSQKKAYDLGDPVRLISTGRQFREKDPSNIMRAIAKLPQFHLTVVGDGPKHRDLVSLSQELNLTDRTSFFRAVPNDALCRMLPDFDIYVTHSEFWEISKSVLEALLTGLPVIINQRKGDPVPELSEDICMLVSDDPTSYEAALTRLTEDDELRGRLGRSAFEISRRHWAPERTEANLARIHSKIALPRCRADQ